MGDNEGPTAVIIVLCVPVASGNRKLYDSDVKTGKIENKTNQTMECPDIMLLFMLIK